jgi:orotidine-5'-phosphate decarboxylase
MMRAARRAAGEDGPRLLGVTILTSFGPTDLARVWKREIQAVPDEVARLAELAAEAGLHGVVASPLEAEAIKRRHGPDFLVITPGIRPEDEDADDQARTATPREAAGAGADFLVVGRPILEAEDRRAVVERMITDIAAATAEAR